MAQFSFSMVEPTKVHVLCLKPGSVACVCAQNRSQNGSFFLFRETLPPQPTKYVKRALGAHGAVIAAVLLGHPPQISAPQILIFSNTISEEDFVSRCFIVPLSDY